MGEFIGKIMSKITFEQATYQVYFKDFNPTNCHKDKNKDFDAEFQKKEDDFDTAFPTSRLPQNGIYQKYLADPLGEGMFEKACKLFGSSPIERSYHVPTSSETYNEVNEKDTPKGPIYPPFLPSVASNGIDV